MAVVTTNLGTITAYGDAVAAGYTGTKEEWQTLMASYATVAETAQGYAEDAQTAASNASDYADNASTYATNASSAQTAAETAQGLAETAQGLAEDAQEAAESARDAVQSSATQISTNTTAIGTLANLTTTEKTNLVGAINEIDADVLSLNADITEIVSGAELTLTDKNRYYIDSSGLVYYRNYFHIKHSPVTAGVEYTVTIVATGGISSSDAVRICYSESAPTENATVTILNTPTISSAGTYTVTVTPSANGYICIAYYGGSISSLTVSNIGLSSIVNANKTAVATLTAQTALNTDTLSAIVENVDKEATRLSSAYINSSNEVYTRNYFSIDYYAVNKGVGYNIDFSVTEGVTSADMIKVVFCADAPTIGATTTPLVNVPTPKSGVYTTQICAPDDGYLCVAHYPSTVSITAVTSINLYQNANTKKVITVDANGTGDYTSLVTALSAITEPTTVRVLEGTYDFADDWTTDELDNANYPSGFYGTTVPQDVDIIGIGARENIIITNHIVDGYTYQDTWSQISLLNPLGNNTFKNLSIVANGLRYAVHDDLESEAYTTLNYIDCIIKMNDLANRVAFGGGTQDGKIINFENCIVQPVLAVHGNNSAYVPPALNIRNTIVNGYFSFGDYAMGKNFPIVIENSTADYLSYYRDSSVTSQCMDIKMYGCSCPFVSTITDAVYHMDGVEYAYSTSAISKGTPVKKADVRAVTAMSSGDIIEQFYGIAMSDITASVIDTSMEYAPIICKGYVSNSILGLADLSVGDLIGVSNGSVSVVESDAIGIVEFVNDSIYYIRLFE